MLSHLWGFKLLQGRSSRAELLLSQVQVLEHGVLACTRQSSSNTSSRSRSSRGRREKREAE